MNKSIVEMSEPEIYQMLADYEQMLLTGTIDFKNLFEMPTGTLVDIVTALEYVNQRQTQPAAVLYPGVLKEATGEYHRRLRSKPKIR